MEQLLEIIKNCNATIILSIITLLSVFVEIVPIKINPISWLIKWIGDKLNNNTREQLQFISDKLEDVSERIDKIEIDNTRSTILDFANSCMNERKHTKEEFEHMFDLHDQYMKTIEERGIKNGRMDMAYKYISDLYLQCVNENSFLE